MAQIIPKYKLSVSIQSEGPAATPGDTTLLQIVTVEEYSDDPALHIQKNMAVAGGVMGAFGALVEQAKADLATESSCLTSQRYSRA